MTNSYNILVGKPEGKTPLGRLSVVGNRSVGRCGLDTSGSG
jgi:hypothetical protein